jgi:conjugative relaxase-like TrwC/TraI family protein
MAGSLTIGKGTCPEYYTAQAARGADYYSAGAGIEGTEPPGLWTGDGCPDLGLEPGSVVDHDAFRVIYGEHVDPRDGSRIGRALQAPTETKDADEIYRRLLAAEPDATGERREQLRIAAKSEAAAKYAVSYFDATFSPSKSITLAHASARAARLAAQDAQDDARATQAQRIEDAVWGAITEGRAAALAHLQAHAGYTRTGAGGVRHEDAHAMVIATWQQHSSRAGDPQLHEHNTILNKVKSDRDGKWRTLDGRGIYRERAAAAAIGTMVMENALTRDLGVEWVLRDDGHGREVKGFSQQLMDEFSKRARLDVGPKLKPLVEAYRETYGHDPDEHALWALGQMAAREDKPAKKARDPREEISEWAQRARSNAGEALEGLAERVCNLAPDRVPAPGAQLSVAQERAIMAQALNALAAKRSTWTRSDLTRAISEQLPADLPVMDAERAAAWLPGLADRAIAGEAGMVVPLEAPDWLPGPESLRRADGESVYTQHRATLYATDAQLQMEARILNAAEERGAHIPRADPEEVAALLGADRAALEAQLAADAPADVTTVTGSGLRMDQAAAAFAIATSDRRAEVMVGPAGTGKSRTVAELSRMWHELFPEARVIGLSVTQQGANVLKAEGLGDSHNIAMFFTDPRLREIPANSLVITDEASMTAMRQVDDITALGGQANAKLALVGDPQQHQAVQAGGAMGMIARRNGSWQLGEPQRFAEDWQRTASLQLRDGDAAAVAAYDRQGRILAGPREQMIEEGARRWTGDYLAGKQSVLIAHDEADAHEMARRVRGELIRYGRVDRSAEVALRDEARASAGDRIMARKNNWQRDAGADGRCLANRDIYEVLGTAQDGSATVRLWLGRDDAGTDRWGEPFRLDRGYLEAECHLAYAGTSHSFQGGTYEHNSYTLVRPGDDRHFLYTAMSRAREGNYALACTDELQPLTAGAPSPAPEVRRARKLEAERAGADRGADLIGKSGAGILAGVMGRGERDESATEVLEREFTEADHLAVLSRWWADVAGEEYSARYAGVLRGILGPDAEISPYTATWLNRTLRGTEAAGMDGRQVLREAAAEGELRSARDPVAVLDSRVRERLGGATALTGTWAARAPEPEDEGKAAFLQAVSKAMDDRTVRLGEHAAEARPLWAERNLGPVPEDPVARLDWQDRAAKVAAYREMSGYASAGDPIGPAPAATNPEGRAAWHAALAALGKVDGIDVRGLSRDQLQVRRQMYARETARMPAHVGPELRAARMARDQASVRAQRAELEAERAKDAAERERHLGNAGMWRGLHERASAAADCYGKAMETREQYDRAHEPTLRIARAADLEARRQEPGGRLEPLKSAEPSSDLVPGDPEPDDKTILSTLRLTPEKAVEPASDHPQRMAAAAARAQEQLDELASMREPSEDEDAEPTEAWAATAARKREAVKQAAVVPMRPSRKVMERDREPARRVVERDREPTRREPDRKPDRNRQADREADFEAGG